MALSDFREFLDIIGEGWRGLALLVLLMLIGVPQLVRLWRDVNFHREELEKRKLQIEILRAYQEILDPSDAAQLDRIRGLAKDLALDESVIGSSVAKQDFGTAMIASILTVALLGFGVAIAAFPAHWLVESGHPIFMLLYLIGICWVVVRVELAHEKRTANDQAENLGPAFYFRWSIVWGAIGYVVVQGIRWLLF